MINAGAIKVFKVETDVSDICYLSRGRGGEGLALLDQWILMWGH